jgi:hypothetical protein
MILHCELSYETDVTCAAGGHKLIEPQNEAGGDRSRIYIVCSVLDAVLDDYLRNTPVRYHADADSCVFRYRVDLFWLV